MKTSFQVILPAVFAIIAGTALAQEQPVNPVTAEVWDFEIPAGVSAKAAFEKWRAQPAPTEPRILQIDGLSIPARESATITDPPRFRKIHGAGGEATFEAYTCLICADEGLENGSVIGCVKWEYSVKKQFGNTKNVKRVINYSDAAYSCGHDKNLQEILKGSREAWDTTEKNKWQESLDQ